MQRRRRINPTDDAKFYASAGRDKVGLDIRYISAFKGRGIFTSTPFEKGDFLLEYRGELISRQECESRQRLYHDSLKVFMFEFRFNGKLWCVDAAKEDGSLGRLVNDDHLNPNAKMKYLTVEGKPHLCLFATRDISPGEEITYNYGESDWPWRCKTLKETSMEGHQDEVSISEPTTGTQKASTSRRRKKASMAASTGQLVKSFDQNPDEEIPQENSETTILTPLTEDFEELMAESSRIQIGEDQIQTSPGPGPLSGHGKNPNEEIPQENSETTILASSSEDFEELMAESSRIQIGEDQIQTSPGPGPLSGHGKCQNHRLVCATVSSLDKCLQCVGPVASLKWLGYKCKVCSGVWHKTCFRRIINENLPHQSQEQQLSKCSEDELLSDEDSIPHSNVDPISDDDQDHSDVDYVPDSEFQDDDEDSDTSIPFMPIRSNGGQIQVKPVIPDAGTSYGSDTGIPVVPSTSKGQMPLKETSGSANSMKTLPKKKKKKLDDQAEPHNQESTHLTMSTKNYCYICGQPQSKISRHLKTHTTHAEVVHVFSLPYHSKERKILLEKMRNKGNFRHNTAVLQGGTGPLKVKRKPKAKAVAGKFVHCMYCQGMYLRKELWRHARRCPCKPEDGDLEKEPGRTKVLGLAVAQESASCHQISAGVWKLLSAMKQDEVASAVRNDLSIIQFAQSLYNRHGQDPTKYEYMRQKLREVGRLLLCLRTDFSVHNLEEAVKPANFQRVVQAVKKVSGFDEEKHSYGTPSLALKLGHTLHKVCDIIHCRALMAEHEELIKSTDTFKKLYSSKWSEMVSHSALNTLSDAKYNKPSTLPFTEDVRILHQYLEKSAESAFCNLKEKATTQNYAQLAKVTLAQIIVFNRRRAGEVSKMRLKSFHERDNTKLHEDVAMGLSKTEQKLCNYFSRIEIMGKRGRKVAVLLTPRMVDALSLLTSQRTECGVCATNIFLFARPKSMTHYRGQDCLRVHASQCGAKHPEHLRSTQLRKHVATLSQVLNLKNNELDQVADFLGHDIRVHRDFYRLPVPTTQLAKISKLLLSMEKGHLSSMQGKSLDEIEIEGEIALSDTEAKDSDSESDGSGTEFTECDTSEAVDAATDSTATEQVHDAADLEAVSSVTSTVNETAPLSERQDAGQDHESRRVPKKVWSKPEVAAVMRHFRGHICKGKLATKNECSHCKLVEGPALAQRTVQNIRDFVRNRGIAAKRQSQKEKL
ncbi:uncharacterized protein LOC131967990 [Centropristis striata]|uniref:uncharacterized protein LOC131967990 n=2 Tax=Centropristis striata TaxID=184440 RepID=UPI0027DF5B88|nr:uncharacterized protein LOC131967990 [Centropristis striata]